MKATALALAAVLVTPALAADREDQWLYRELDAGVMMLPRAVFLDWTYSRVLFRVDCDPVNKKLTFYYAGDGVVAPTADAPMGLGFGLLTPLPMPTTAVNGWLVASINSSAVLNAWPAGADVYITAPNEMGEPWSVGQAEPLRRVAENCR